MMVEVHGHGSERWKEVGGAMVESLSEPHADNAGVYSDHHDSAINSRKCGARRHLTWPCWKLIAEKRCGKRGGPWRRLGRQWGGHTMDITSCCSCARHPPLEFVCNSLGLLPNPAAVAGFRSPVKQARCRGCPVARSRSSPPHASFSPPSVLASYFWSLLTISSTPTLSPLTPPKVSSCIFSSYHCSERFCWRFVQVLNSV